MVGFDLEFTRDDKDNVYYRYRMNSTLFWFWQHKSSGEICRVIIEDEKYPSIPFYVDGFPYPTRVSFTMPAQEISSYKDETEYNKMFQYLCLVRSQLMRFFETSEHARLFWENHKDKENKK